MESITSPPMQQGSSGSILSPLLISMLGILLTSLALIVYHFFLIKYCMSRHHTATTQPEPAAPSPTGIDDKLLQTIPVFTFSAVKRDMDQEECVVCLGELEDDDMVRLLPNCKHAFHLPCIDRWFAAHASCPLCRSPAVVEEINVVPCPESHRTSDSDCETSTSVPSPREQSFGLLRHCASLVLPPPVDRRSLPRLKRSMSMDQSLVVINLQRANCFSGSSSSSSRGRVLRRSGSCSTRSMSHFDRMPSMWLRSFSRLRSGKGNNGPILPY
ncbi:RING-H2 finger protein ATL52 [Sesamum angolense]|uniref:RING-type E3 ubiquitin transferase n=1 Tax=Sesamum angolense TaxID=2727404 RepID=A0AAE1WMT1_9LAMI|nr:RING-H2 finger protein ATL52 [Sesamum angolense]